MSAQKLAVVGVDKDLLDVLGDCAVAIFDPGHRGQVMGIPVIGGDDAWTDYRETHPDVAPLLAIDPPGLRRKLSTHYGADAIASYIDAGAHVSRHARLSRAIVIQRGVLISADVELGEGVRINVGAQLHHDCRLGAFTTVAPGALLMGSVTVGDGVYVGAGAIVLQGLTVGDGARIGAGAVVTKSVAAGVTVRGMPARAP